MTYELLNSTSNGTLYFFLDRDTGEISNRRALTEAPLNLYTVSRFFLNLLSLSVFYKYTRDAPENGLMLFNFLSESQKGTRYASEEYIRKIF